MACGSNGVEVTATVGWNWLVDAIVEGAEKMPSGWLAIRQAERLETAAAAIRIRLADSVAARGEKP